jgi:lactam utilization protein B
MSEHLPASPEEIARLRTFIEHETIRTRRALARTEGNLDSPNPEIAHGSAHFAEKYRRDLALFALASAALEGDGVAAGLQLAMAANAARAADLDRAGVNLRESRAYAANQLRASNDRIRLMIPADVRAVKVDLA